MDQKYKEEGQKASHAICIGAGAMISPVAIGMLCSYPDSRVIERMIQKSL